MNKPTSLVLAYLAAMTTSGCLSPISTDNPRSPATPPVGSVSVCPFDYLPAESGEVLPNHAQNDSPSPKNEVYFDNNVDVLVREALIKKLPSVGIRVDSPDKAISGDIEELSVTGSVSGRSYCILRIRYRISAGTAVTYESVKDVTRSREGGFDPHAALDDLVDLSILELLKDQAFLKAIR